MSMDFHLNYFRKRFPKAQSEGNTAVKVKAEAHKCKAFLKTGDGGQPTGKETELKKVVLIL